MLGNILCYFLGVIMGFMIFAAISSGGGDE